MLDYLRAALTVRLRSQRGATAVEYAMLVAMVGLIAGILLGFQDLLGFIFKDTAERNSVSIDGAP